MRKITVSGFGTISKLDLQLDDNLSVIIGAQASGKSTIVKLIYYCRKITDYLVGYLADPNNFSSIHPNEYYTYFLKFLRKKFMGCFGTTKHMAPFRIVFDFDYREGVPQNKTISISLEDGYAKFYFSRELQSHIYNLLREVSQLWIGTSSTKVTTVSSNEDLYSSISNLYSLIDDFKKRQLILEHYSKVVKDLFCDDEEILYIPAGRSILATLSDQLHGLDVSIMDLPLQEFITLIDNTRRKFGIRIPEIIRDYTKTENGQIKNSDVELAYAIIKNILRGDYVSETDGEKIYYNEHEYVKLMYSSSGQQEVLWILLIIFIKILEHKKVFLVLEEPEAHLFPIAQRKVVELISLLINSTNSSVFITTHSPYILTSINLSVYSAKVENKIKTDSEPIVPKMLRVDPSRMDAYFIDNSDSFSFNSIKDSEEQLIDATQIDRISSMINDSTEKILDLEIEHGL